MFYKLIGKSQFIMRKIKANNLDVIKARPTTSKKQKNGPKSCDLQNLYKDSSILKVFKSENSLKFRPKFLDKHS